MIMMVGGKRVSVSVFRSEALARAWAARSGELVVMGDAGAWWACRPVDAARLARAGYEIAAVVGTGAT